MINWQKHKINFWATKKLKLGVENNNKRKRQRQSKKGPREKEIKKGIESSVA